MRSPRSVAIVDADPLFAQAFSKARRWYGYLDR